MDFSKKLPAGKKRRGSTGRKPTAAPRAAAIPALPAPPRKPSRSSGSGRISPLLTREGTVVRFEPSAGSAALYSHAPPSGTTGVTISLPVPGGRKVYVPGPGGGLVYVGWDGYGTQGVAPQDLEVISAAKTKTTGSGGLSAVQQKIFDRAARAIQRDTARGELPRLRSWQALQGVRDAKSYLLNARGEVGLSVPEGDPFALNKMLTPVIESLDRWLRGGGAEKGAPRDNPHAGDYGTDATEFSVGERVELSPHLDLWARGARFGTVVSIVRRSGRVRVRLDRLPNKVFSFVPGSLAHRYPAVPPITPRKNPARPKRKRPAGDPTSRMIQHGMCDAWLCTNIAQYETRSERGEARRLCKKCLRVVAQAEANKASNCAPRA